MQAAPGLQVDVDQVQLLKKFCAPRAAESLRFVIEGAPFEASVTLSPETKPPDAMTLTKVRGSQDGIGIRHTIRLTTNRGLLPNLKLHVKDWPYEPLLLDAPSTR